MTLADYELIPEPKYPCRAVITTITDKRLDGKLISDNWQKDRQKVRVVATYQVKDKSEGFKVTQFYFLPKDSVKISTETALGKLMSLVGAVRPMDIMGKEVTITKAPTKKGFFRWKIKVD